MTVYSPERDAYDSLSIAARELEIERFNPAEFHALLREDGVTDPLNLQRTAPLRASSKIVAAYSTVGEQITRANTRDIIHPQCDFGVLVRPILEREVEDAEVLTHGTGWHVGSVWAVDLLKPALESEHVLEYASKTKLFIRNI